MPTSKHSLFTEATAQPIDLLWIDGELRELTLVKYNYHNTLLSKYWILDPFYPCRRQGQSCGLPCRKEGLDIRIFGTLLHSWGTGFPRHNQHTFCQQCELVSMEPMEQSSDYWLQDNFHPD